MRSKIKDFILYYTATGFGSGLSPIASGTAGSAVATVLVFLVWPESFLIQLAICLGTTMVSIYASGWLAESIGKEDPKEVVADEFSGQFFTFLFINAGLTQDWRILLLGFLLFRGFDIWKPWPVSRLEDLPGGWGIVMDDVLAGIFANLVLRVALIWM